MTEPVQNSSAGSEHEPVLKKLRFTHSVMQRARLDGKSCLMSIWEQDIDGVAEAIKILESSSEVEPVAHNGPVAGSNPASPTTTFSVAQPVQVTDALVEAGAIGLMQDVAEHDQGPSFYDASEQSRSEAKAMSRACLTAALAAQPPAATVGTDGKDDYTWYDAYNKLSAAYMGIIAERDAALARSSADIAEANLAELTDGHLALDRLGAAREEENGIEVAICERINEIAARLRAPPQSAGMREALESIANWRRVNISGEYEHGLRDIIRSITDCAAAALEASPLSRPQLGSGE